MTEGRRRDCRGMNTRRGEPCICRRASEHAPPGLPRAQHDTLQRTAVERSVLRLAGELSRLDLPDAIGVEQAEIRRAAPGETASLDAEQRRRTRRQQSDRLGQGQRAVVHLRQGHAEQGREPGASRRGLGEGLALVVGIARLMVGGDRVDRAVGERRHDCQPVASLRSGGDSLA